MKKKNIVTFFVFLFILFIISNLFSYHKNLKLQNYKEINSVPVTKSMAKNLSNCSSYTQTYSDALSLQIWTNTLGYKYYFKIKGKSGDYCKIQTYTKVFNSKNKYTETYEIPLGLAKYSADILFEHANYGGKTDAYEQFCECAGKMHLQYSGSFSELVDYWKEWDKNNVYKELKFHNDEPKNDNYTCKQWKMKINEIVTTPEFHRLQTNDEKIKKISSELRSNMPKTLRQSGFGYDKNQQMGRVEFQTDYSKCKIKYNNTGVIEYKFDEIPVEKRSNLAKFNTPKCW